VVGLCLDHAPGETLRVLCIGAHSDDIEIGCGATLLALIRSRKNVEVRWIVFSAHASRVLEAENSAQLFLQGAARVQVEVLGFRDGFLPWQGAEVKEIFEAQKGFAPHLVFTHYGQDRHQDHRILSDLAWNTFRSHLIVEYEIPKYDGDLGLPNLFVPIEDEVRQRKIDLLMEVFGTQRSKAWFTPDTFNALMRLRGVECASPTGYAEAFHARKILLPAR
jgi:LmbE family N-acetylglucosaminyl deacetylase